MEKVYVVVVEDAYDLSLSETRVKVFGNKDKAKEYMNEEFEQYLDAEEITKEDLVVEDYENGVEAEYEDYVLEESNESILVYRDGWYVENHIKIILEETEIL